ncbi:MAG: hypothetical protein ACREL7_03450 [Longimicrobiales bacterium]
MKRFHAIGLVVLAVLLTASCSSRRGQQGNSYPPITVSIENQNFYDATVYLSWRGDRRRLGVVGGNTTQTFESPWFGPEVTIQIDLLAGGRRSGDPIGISPGEELVVQIPASIDRLRVIRRGD